MAYYLARAKRLPRPVLILPQGTKFNGMWIKHNTCVNNSGDAYIYIYIYISKLISIGSNNGLSPGRCQAIILTDIVNWTLRNKLQWYFNRNSYILIQENAFENVVWKIAAILSRSQFVKLSNLRHSYCCIMNRYKNTDSGTNKFKVHNDWHFSRSIYARGNVLPLR